MSKYTNLMMRLISHTVVKAPLLFPERYIFMKRLHWVVKDYFKYEEQGYEGYEDIKTFSLFEPSLKWKAKAISKLIAISGDDAKSLLKWKSKQETFREVHTGVSIFSQGLHNIGNFKTGSGAAQFKIDAYLVLDSKYVESCNVHLITLNNGHYYLSVYWFLKDEATLALRCVDVADIKISPVEYYTCNPFSKRFGHCQLPNKYNASQQLILNNIEDIYNDLTVVEKRLFQILGISSRGNQAATLDVHVDESEPYYIEYTPEKKLNTIGMEINPPNFRANESLVSRFDLFNALIEDRESKEFLVNIPELSNSSIDLVFIKSQLKEELGEFGYNDFAHWWYHPVDSHLTYSFIELIEKNYKSLDKKFSESLLSTYSEPKKSYQNVYKAFIETSIIEGQIQSILQSQSIFSTQGDVSILKDFMRRTQLYLNDIKNIKLDIEAKKTAANELVQAANLTYQKRMTWLVVGLAFVQIFIAAPSVDTIYLGEKITSFTKFLNDFFN